MKRLLLALLLSSFSTLLLAQGSANEYYKYPVFPACDAVDLEQLPTCFQQALNTFIFENFQLPEVVTEENYQGKMVALFEVTEEGQFKLLYVDAIYDELKVEVQRVFTTLPQIQAPTYNGRPTVMQFTLPIPVPLNEEMVVTNIGSRSEVTGSKIDEAELKKEFDAVSQEGEGYESLEFESQLNVPFSHDRYAQFDRSMNLVGVNNHTASKPFRFAEVSRYFDLEGQRDEMLKAKTSYGGRKLWNEHFVTVNKKDYWFTIDPVLDLQLGVDTKSELVDYTYNNTRGIQIQGGIGKHLNFFTTVFESQGRFAEYVNRYTERIRPAGGNPGIVPGRGIAKRFKDDAFDYPVAEAYLSYSPSKTFNFQFGHGNNFIGDGYRSLLLSDVASPHPFLKINTEFWKIKYTNTWMWLRDVRAEALDGSGAFLTKFMANHYLSWNVSKRLNIGLFESVMWLDDNGRGFDVNYLNPVIFYRAIEFSTGSRAGNAILGASAKYKFNDRFNMYGQFILDEFSLEDIRAGNQSFKNKFGYQIGAKYYNAFGVENLLLQAEYNHVRPYTYSHNTIVLNYGHNNQPMAHLWGANFEELIGIARYQKGRWFGNAKLIYGRRGLDFNEGGDTFAYGGDVFTSEDNRPGDNGNAFLQGNETTVFIGDLQAGYIVNPSTNLKLFANVTYRSFNPVADTMADFQETTTWINFGIRTDLFNWYFDF